MKQFLLILASAALIAAVVRADDLKLTDGSTISGAIVGFDDNSFKVQTSYGFALVRKDQVVSITVSDNKKGAPEAQQQSGANEKSAAQATAYPAPPSGQPRKIVAPATPAVPARKPVLAAKTVPAPSIPTRSGSAPPVLASLARTQAAPPDPGPIREEVDGSTYVNESYGFRMYKPPDWEVIAGAQSLMPGAIAAMGTDDQTTYLLIGEGPAGKSMASDMDATDQRLRSLMDNFRPLGESHINISGIQAVERRFRGSVDDQDWSGTVVFIARGGELYTIFGMTIAETDLVQIQENVIARAISSLQFAQ